MLRSHSSIASRHGAVLKWMVLVLAAPCFGYPIFSLGVVEKYPTVPDDAYHLVSRGPMELLVTQSGDLDSADNAVLISKCEWSTRLISIVPEGTWVEEGDVIAELDASAIRSRFQERAILLVNATARLADAEQDLQIQKLINESKLAAAELQMRMAQLQLDGYLEAEYPQKLHQLEADVALAEEDLARGFKKLEFVEGMVKRGYRLPNDRDAERIELLKKKQNLERAQDKLNVLQNFMHERTLTQLQSQAEETKREYERVKLKAKATLLSREITLRARQRSHDIYAGYQDRLQANIDACVIRAPRAGEVVYANERSSSRTQLSEGSSVIYLQPVCKIPDRNRLQVQLRVHESNIRLIEQNQSALVKIDAVSGAQYLGRVSNVSTVPVSGRYPNYDLREYRVTIDLEITPEQARSLAPGLTAQVSIIAAQRSSTVRIPIQSVVEIGDELIAFVKSGNNVEPRVLEVGINNDLEVEVLSGLEEGDQIVGRPRVTCAQRILALRKEVQKLPEEELWISQAY